jgi:hypothetical protein
MRYPEILRYKMLRKLKNPPSSHHVIHKSSWQKGLVMAFHSIVLLTNIKHSWEGETSLGKDFHHTTIRDPLSIL